MTNQETQYPIEHLVSIQETQYPIEHLASIKETEKDQSNKLVIEEILEPKSIGVIKSEEDQNSLVKITTEEPSTKKTEETNIIPATEVQKEPLNVTIEIPEEQLSAKQVIINIPTEESSTIDTTLTLGSFISEENSVLKKNKSAHVSFINNNNKENISPKRTNNLDIAVQKSPIMEDSTTMTEHHHNVNRCLFVIDNQLGNTSSKISFNKLDEGAATPLKSKSVQNLRMNANAKNDTPDSDDITEFEESFSTPFKPKSWQWLCESDTGTPVKSTPSYFIDNSSDNLDPMSKTLESYNKLRENFPLCTPKIVSNVKLLMTPNSGKSNSKKNLSRKIQHQLFLLNETSGPDEKSTEEKSSQSIE